LTESEETESSETENARKQCRLHFYAKSIIHHKFVLQKLTVNCKFYKDAIRRFSRDSGPVYQHILLPSLTGTLLSFMRVEVVLIQQTVMAENVFLGISSVTRAT
jgi:hypothetical protein